MAIAPPIRFTDSVETRQKDEQQTIEALNATFDKILETTSSNSISPLMPVHQCRRHPAGRDKPAAQLGAQGAGRGRRAPDGRTQNFVMVVPRPCKAAGRGPHRRMEAGGQPVPNYRHHPRRTAGQLGCRPSAEGRRGDALLALDRAGGAPAAGQHQSCAQRAIRAFGRVPRPIKQMPDPRTQRGAGVRRAMPIRAVLVAGGLGLLAIPPRPAPAVTRGVSYGADAVGPEAGGLRRDVQRRGVHPQDGGRFGLAGRLRSHGGGQPLNTALARPVRLATALRCCRPALTQTPTPLVLKRYLLATDQPFRLGPKARDCHRWRPSADDRGLP